MQSLRIKVGYCYVFYVSQLPCTKLDMNTHKHRTRLKRVEYIVLTVPDGQPNSQLGFCFCQHGFLSSSSEWRFNSKEQNKQVLRALYLSALVASNFRKCYIRTVKLMLIVIYELNQNSLQNVNFKSLIYSSVFFLTVVSFPPPPPKKKKNKQKKKKKKNKTRC